MTHSRLALIALLLTFALFACGDDRVVGTESDDQGEPMVNIEALAADGSPEAVGILGVANDGAFTVVRYISDVGLTRAPA